MSELASTEFRKSFAKLNEPTLVTVNGHPIGVWTPVSISWTETPDGTVDLDVQSRAGTPAAIAQTSQAQRDDLLRKINRQR